MVQGADPAQLPELDLLRQRRLRDRVGRADLLLLQPRRLRQPARASRACASVLQPARGRAAGRRWSPRRARTTRSSTRSRPSAGATSCCCACSSRATSRAPIYDDEKAAGRCPTRDDLTFPKEDTDYPYFTSWIKQQVVDQLGGGQQGAQRAFEGGLRVKTTIDSRLQTRRREGDRGTGCRTRRARAPRSSRSPTRTAMVRAMVGGDNYGDRAVQPRHAGPAPARLLVQAVRARRGAAPGHQPAVDLGVEEADLHPQGRRALHGQQLRGRLRRRDARSRTRRRSPTTPSTPRSASRSSTKKVAKLARRMGVRTPVSTQPRDGARRPAPGRDAAGHGARLRDVRDRRQARLRHALARPERQEPARARAGRDRAHRQASTASKTRAVELDDGQQDGQQAQDAQGAQARGRRPRSPRSCRPSSRRAPRRARRSPA